MPKQSLRAFGALTTMLLGAAVHGRAADFYLPVGAIPTPEYPPARDVPYLPPPPPQFRLDTASEILPRWLCGCGCGVLVYPRDLSLPDAPVQLLAMALRGASSTEVWRLSSDVSPGTMAQLRRFGLTFRGAAILGVARTTEAEQMVRLFSATVNAVTQETDMPIEIEGGPARPKRVEDMVDALNFRPDVAITFVGAYPARVEFDWAAHVILIQVPGEWGFVAVKRRAIDDMRAMTDSMPALLLTPTATPTDVFAGSTD